MALYGSPILFAGTSLGLQVNPYYPYLLQPIPNQGMMLALSSAPVSGSYMHFYRDIRQHLTRNTAGFGGPLVSYTINAGPDFSLRDRNNALLPTNALGTLSYSSNGSWMLVDTPGGGSFIRVNMATFDILPFAQSLTSPGEYSTKYGATAISDDGRYAAVASNDNYYFRVYDLTTCTGTTNNNYSQPLSCQYRDYWPSMATKISGFRSISALRFINDDNISMTAVYNWQSSSSYSAAKFTVTAPGKEAHSLDYLALGDSYISGQGEFQYKDGTDTDQNTCHLSPLSYPFTLGTDLYNQYNSIACSGAKTKDITGGNIPNYNSDPGGAQSLGKSGPTYDSEIYSNYEPGYRVQLEFIKRYQPRAVTLSIGGNDIGFSDIVKKCVMESTIAKDCYNSYDARMSLVKQIQNSFTDLQQTYRAILDADPGVQLYIVGYPQVVTQPPNPLLGCSPNVHLTPDDISFAQNVISYLDWTIQQAANSEGARYVDVENALAGHRLCETGSSNVAMNGVTAGNDSGLLSLKVIGSESFHPNVLGHQLLAQAILQQTNNMKQAMPTANTSIKAPTINDPQTVAFLAGYPVSSTKFADVITADDSIAASSAVRSVGTAIAINGTSYGLKPNSNYQVTLANDTQSISLASATTNANGDLNLIATVPVSVSVGYQKLSIQGTNLAGQTIEIYKFIYVAASTDDANGDGVPDSQNSCFILPESGIDADSDGVDDACDPVIGDAPKPSYPAQVHLTGNTILITNP